MAFWCRTNLSRLQHLTHQFKRCYIQVPSIHQSAPHSSIFSEAKKPLLGNTVNKRIEFCSNVRFFAAPAQVQKKDDKDASGPCLNDQITAQFIRLVLDEGGHKVVSRHEALALARKLRKDLVEVDRHGKPPVCKIMDFHKERYQKELKEKDRAKAKSDMALKKGDCKEVRFSGKIEHKDLQMKADTARRLMEKGYRVKCMALPVGKKEETEDLRGYLSRLIDLIEDISVVESGPHVERKQAYAIIRHMKFGPPKKGGLKKSKAVGATNGDSKTAAQPPTIDHSRDIPRPAMHENDPAEEKNTPWSVSNSNDHLSEIFSLSDDMKGATSDFRHEVVNTAASERGRSPTNINASNFSLPKPGPAFSIADSCQSGPPKVPLGAENRYANSEPRNQFAQKPIDNLEPGMRESFRSEPQFPYQSTQPSPPNMNAPPSVGEKKPIGTEASAFRNLKLPNSMLKREPPHTDGPNTQPSGYGIFSSLTAKAPAGQGVSADTNKGGIPTPGTAGGRSTQNIPDTQRPGPDKGQGRFGIFSK